MANGDESDHDRGAILARRQRFIAIALTSLAAACANRPSPPQPCLSPPQPEPRDTDASGGDVDPQSDEGGAETPPGEPPIDAPPQPCLKVAKPG